MRRRSLFSLLIGATGGLWAGLLGVGGGIVIVPMLTGLLGLPRYRAHGTSLAIMTPLALAAGVVYALGGYVDWPLALETALGSIVGAVLGAALMHRIPERYLRQGFGVLVLVVAVRMALG